MAAAAGQLERASASIDEDQEAGDDSDEYEEENDDVGGAGEANMDYRERLLNALKRVGNNYVGTFVSYGRIDDCGSLIAVDVDGVGRLLYPVSQEQCTNLIAHAHLAEFGRGSETVVDTAVRRSFKIEAQHVSMPNPIAHDYIHVTLLKRALTALGVPSDRLRLCSLSLHQLLVYDVGSFFLSHTDTEKAAGMFATMVVTLPSRYSGGEFIVRHAGQTVTIDFNKDNAAATEFTPHFICFYADCPHEIKPLTAGHRITLVYNVCMRQTSAASSSHRLSLPAPPNAQQLRIESQIENILREWLSQPNHPTLSSLMEHQYTQASLGPTALKGRDRVVADALVNAAARLNSGRKPEILIYLCSVEMQCSAEPEDETDTATEYYQSSDDDEPDAPVETGYDGRTFVTSTVYWPVSSHRSDPPPFYASANFARDVMVNVKIDADEWRRGHLYKKKPDHEYHGNYSSPPELYYRSAAILIVRYTERYRIVAQHLDAQEYIEEVLGTIQYNSSISDELLNLFEDAFDIVMTITRQLSGTPNIIFALRDLLQFLQCCQTVDHPQIRSKQADITSHAITCFNSSFNAKVSDQYLINHVVPLLTPFGQLVTNGWKRIIDKMNEFEAGRFATITIALVNRDKLAAKNSAIRQWIYAVLVEYEPIVVRGGLDNVSPLLTTLKLLISISAVEQSENFPHISANAIAERFAATKSPSSPDMTSKPVANPTITAPLSAYLTDGIKTSTELATGLVGVLEWAAPLKLNEDLRRAVKTLITYARQCLTASTPSTVPANPFPSDINTLSGLCESNQRPTSCDICQSVKEVYKINGARRLTIRGNRARLRHLHAVLDIVRAYFDVRLEENTASSYVTLQRKMTALDEYRNIMTHVHDANRIVSRCEEKCAQIATPNKRKREVITIDSQGDEEEEEEVEGEDEEQVEEVEDEDQDDEEEDDDERDVQEE